MTITQAFDRSAAAYDAGRRKFIPCFDDFYGAAGELLTALLGEDAPGEPQILDLGAGTGLLSARALECFPSARLTLVDLADGMLDQARARFAGLPEDRLRVQVADYATAALDGPWTAVISALSIHHLEDGDKQQLFDRIRGALQPGGVFVNADFVAGPSLRLNAWYHRRWQEQVCALGATGEELAGAIERQSYDRLASLEAQLRWLEAAGFEHVDCLYKNGPFAVYGGIRP